jgi:RND superfamily putative drug exporter
MSARHPWRVLGLWVVLVAVAYFAAGTMNLTAPSGSAGTEATKASDLIDQRLRHDTPPEEFIVVESPGMTAGEPGYAAFVDALVGNLRGLKEVNSVTSYRDGDQRLVSADGHIVLIPVTLIGDKVDAADNSTSLIDAVEAADADGAFRVTTVGFGSVENEMTSSLEKTLQQGEMIGIVVALVILVVVFGAVVAAGLPIALALLSIFVAVGATALVSNTMETSNFVVFIITMIGLAVGIDYSLFIVQRFREERVLGMDKIDAIATAGATASRTVMFSGMAVAIALAGMLIMPDATFRSFAVGAILVVAATVLAAMTLLPAVLGLMGDRVNWLTRPFIGRRGRTDGGGAWSWVAHAVMARPVISVVITGGLLVAAAAPVFDINLGSVGISSLPNDSNSRHAFDVINRDFSDGVLTADVVIDTADVNDPEVRAAIAELKAAIEADGFFGNATLETNQAGDLALLTVAMPGDFSSSESRSALERLRGDYIPAAFDGVPADVSVGGATAETVDSVQLQRDYLPLVFTFVLGLSFLLLVLVFRSIVVPFKAVLLNLLSAGAAYGILVLVFQHGIGAHLLGFREAPVIESWLPLFLFAILFGLSMDYHVFLLSRIKEHYDETRDNAASVAHGLRTTASIITGAALIMVAVFAGMASGDLVTFQQVGFGLAVAVILDATIIRMVLVPASMELLGDWNWYFPKWLEWLPKINIEGALVPAGADVEAADEAAPAVAASVSVAAAAADTRPATEAPAMVPATDAAPRRKGSAIGSFFGRLGLILIGVVVMAAIVGGTAVALAVNGGPQACEPGGEPIVVDDAHAEAFNTKWDAFEAALDSGSPASVTFSESEVTSRLNAWNDEKDIFEEIQVCLHDGYGEATGTLDGGGVVDASFKLTGTVKLDGNHPKADISDIDLGKVPGILAALWEGEAEDPINDALDQVDLGHTYTVSYFEGAVRIDGQP